MTLTGMKSTANTLETRFAELYSEITLGDRKCFKLADGRIISLGMLISYGAFVIEYADNLDEALLNRFEDGDTFYLEDMSTKEMLAAMLQEIEQ